MTKEQKLEMFSMRLDGASFQEIADRFGVSRQRVQQILARGVSTRYSGSSKCIYPNLTNWIREREWTVNRFAAEAGVCSSTLYFLLSGGKESRKGTIDKILACTGMTYEEAFAPSEGVTDGDT